MMGDMVLWALLSVALPASVLGLVVVGVVRLLRRTAPGRGSEPPGDPRDRDDPREILRRG